MEREVSDIIAEFKKRTGSSPIVLEERLSESQNGEGPVSVLDSSVRMEPVFFLTPRSGILNLANPYYCPGLPPGIGFYPLVFKIEIPHDAYEKAMAQKDMSVGQRHKKRFGKIAEEIKKVTAKRFDAHTAEGDPIRLTLVDPKSKDGIKLILKIDNVFFENSIDMLHHQAMFDRGVVADKNRRKSVDFYDSIIKKNQKEIDNLKRTDKIKETDKNQIKKKKDINRHLKEPER